jgi:hypothetical protein
VNGADAYRIINDERRGLNVAPQSAAARLDTLTETLTAIARADSDDDLRTGLAQLAASAVAWLQSLGQTKRCRRCGNEFTHQDGRATRRIRTEGTVYCSRRCANAASQAAYRARKREAS